MLVLTSLVASANHCLDIAMLRGVLSEALKKACGKEPSQKILNTSLIMIQDRQVMDMIGVFYMIMEFFFLDKKVDLGSEFFLLDKQENIWPDLFFLDRKLDDHELVDLIKSRNTAYSLVTTEVCKAMYEVLNSSHYLYRLPVSCRGRRWFAVGYEFRLRGFKRDKEREWENEAISIYRQMVRDSDKLKASKKPSLEMGIGQRLTHGFEHLLGSRSR